MIITFIIYVFIGYLLILRQNFRNPMPLFNWWLAIFAFYSVYLFMTHSYIINPHQDYFVSFDQIFFYSSVEKLASSSYIDIWDQVWSDYSYHELPLAIILFSYLFKIADLLGIEDHLLFLKLNNVFLASIIYFIIYKILIIKLLDAHRIKKEIFIFAIVSPLLLYSCQLVRDIHVCFLYVLICYVAIKPNLRFRFALLFLLFIITFFFRIESGLFSLTFLYLAYYKKFQSQNIFIKLTIVILLAIIVFYSYYYISETLSKTMTNYTTRNIEFANQGSLGVRLNYLPFPVNYLSKLIFSQILPFPLWDSFRLDESYKYLRFIECIFPFYWVTMLSVIIYYWIPRIRTIDREISIAIVICILYLLLISSVQFGIRRQFAVYPILFYLSIYIIHVYKVKRGPYIIFSSISLVLLHVLYIFIK